MPQPDKPGPGRLIVGGALLIVGILVLVPSGLCTTFLGALAVGELISRPQDLLSDIARTWQTSILIPLVSIVAIALILVGRAIRGRS